MTRRSSGRQRQTRARTGAAVRTRYLIVGNSAGAIGAAEAIRQVDGQGRLTIVSDESYPAYSRPRISDYLAGLCTLEETAIRPPQFYADQGIECLLGQKVMRLDLRRGLAELDGGARVAWERLLLATGAAPVLPPIPGLDREGVFTFTTIDDARRLRQALRPGSRAVVVGAGLIGLSAGHALAHLRVPLTMVEMLDRVLATALDREASAVVERALTKAGIRLELGQTVSAVLGRPDDERRVGSVLLESGERFPCDLVVVAAGVKPRAELAAAAGLAVNRGVLVDRRLATSHPGVYACGDAAEGYDFVHRDQRVIPVWPNAYMGGRVAGFNMAGVDTVYHGAAGMNALSYFGLAVVAAGVVEPPDEPGYEVLTAAEGDRYRKVVLRDNRVAGLVFVGDIAPSGIVFGLMRDGIDVAGFKEALVSDRFGLAWLPEELRRDRLAAATAVSAGGHGSVRIPAGVGTGTERS